MSAAVEPEGGWNVDGSPGDLDDPPAIPPELSQRADELLALENARITDSWLEES